MAGENIDTSPTGNSALGLLERVADIAPATSPVVAAAATASTVKPSVSDSGRRLPQGRIPVVTGDPALAKKFVSNSDQFQVLDSNKEDKGMDLLTWYMLASPDQNDPNAQNGTSFTEGFRNLVRTLGIEDEIVTINGQQTTMGELADRLVSSNPQIEGFPDSAPHQILSEYNFSPNSPVAAGALRSAESRASRTGVLDDIQFASRAVGVDYGYMLLKAQQESSFNPNARAGSSSATGLYQFLNATWIETANKHEDLLQRHMGIDVDSLSRQELLGLRTNPRAAALMGAAFAQDNAEYLRRNVNVAGFQVDSSALYMAHFLGRGGAEDFYEALARNPNATAAALMPAAAAANPNVLGRGRTLAEVAEWSRDVVAPSPSPA